MMGIACSNGSTPILSYIISYHMINFLRYPPFKQLKVLQQYYDGLDTKRVVLRVDDGYCLQQWIHPPVQLRADELHLNSLRRAQHYISFAHHIIPDLSSFSFYILPLYNSFSTLHLWSWAPMCNRLCLRAGFDMHSCQQACDYYLPDWAGD